MPDLTARNIAFAALVIATVAAALAAVVLLARQNDNAPILIIPPQEAPAQAAAPGSSPTQAQSERLIDLNLASAGLLDTLPGIGPALAQAIIDYREGQHGTDPDIIKSEMSAAGYQLFADHTFLERQSFLIFRVGDG